jgi:hypothetical protein
MDTLGQANNGDKSLNSRNDRLLNARGLTKGIVTVRVVHGMEVAAREGATPGNFLRNIVACGTSAEHPDPF